MISYKEKFMFKVNKVHAHCDIPCKVYDPSIAQYAALSVVRLIDIIEEAVSYTHLTLPTKA